MKINITTKTRGHRSPSIATQQLPRGGRFEDDVVDFLDGDDRIGVRRPLPLYDLFAKDLPRHRHQHTRPVLVGIEQLVGHRQESAAGRDHFIRQLPAVEMMLDHFEPGAFGSPRECRNGPAQQDELPTISVRILRQQAEAYGPVGRQARLFAYVMGTPRNEEHP